MHADFDIEIVRDLPLDIQLKCVSDAQCKEVGEPSKRDLQLTFYKVDKLEKWSKTEILKLVYICRQMNKQHDSE
jgi:hypothetical protein